MSGSLPFLPFFPSRARCREGHRPSMGPLFVLSGRTKIRGRREEDILPNLMPSVTPPKDARYHAICNKKPCPLHSPCAPPHGTPRASRILPPGLSSSDIHTFRMREIPGSIIKGKHTKLTRASSFLSRQGAGSNRHCVPKTTLPPFRARARLRRANPAPGRASGATFGAPFGCARSRRNEP